MNGPIQLSIEQQFYLKSFETQVAQMSPEQLRDIVLMLNHQLLAERLTYQQMLKRSLKS